MFLKSVQYLSEHIFGRERIITIYRQAIDLNSPLSIISGIIGVKADIDHIERYLSANQKIVFLVFEF